jgi:hypothetical protein
VQFVHQAAALPDVAHAGAAITVSAPATSATAMAFLKSFMCRPPTKIVSNMTQVFGLLTIGAVLAEFIYALYARLS